MPSYNQYSKKIRKLEDVLHEHDKQYTPIGTSSVPMLWETATGLHLLVAEAIGTFA